MIKTFNRRSSSFFSL